MEFAGSVKKKFYFPASPEDAFTYLADIEQVMTHFSAVDIIERSADGSQYRLRYRSKELGLYTVDVFCDVLLEQAPERHSLALRPLLPTESPFEPIIPKVESTQLVAAGQFMLEVGIVEESLEKSIVDYDLTINTLIELGDVLGFIAQKVVVQMVSPMLNDRLDEIVYQFIKNAVTDYRSRKKV